MITNHRHVAGSFLVMTTLAVVAMSPDALADGACCMPDNSCIQVSVEPECGGAGVFLDGQNCELDPCGVGACCNDQNNCIGETNAYGCITSGRTFGGAGTTCLDDPCDSGIGACCTDDICTDASPQLCDASSGTWLGAGTNCSQSPCEIGPCCSPGDCTDLRLFECDAIDGTFGVGATCDVVACLVPTACPLDSMFVQERSQPNGFGAFRSEEGALQRYDNYSGVPGTIESVTFWGLELNFLDPGLETCIEGDPTFQISFHEDAFGVPGPALCTQSVTATRTPTGILYQEVELIEYRVDLIQFCVLPAGWISIVGQGEEDCDFYWMSGLGGNGSSYCDGCIESIEGSDLAFCIGGTFGNALGACCDYNDGACIDDVLINDCLTAGLDFEFDTTCAELDPLCAQTQGACCFDTGVCFLDLPDPCVIAGGSWLGPDVPCTVCPEVGACCFGDTCSQQTESDCAKFSGVWLGNLTDCIDCPPLPTCDKDALFSLPPDGPSDFEAGSSELSAGFRRFQDYTGALGTIEEVVFWGVDLDHIGGNAFAECEETDPTFTIAFHQDAAGVPGAEIASFEVLATRTPTGFLYLGTELNEYRATLPAPIVQADGWISIQGLGDPECWFLWMSAGPGSSFCIGCGTNIIDFEFAVCLNGTQGNVFGACCDQLTEMCTDRVSIADCVGDDLRFEADTTCAELDPVCGVIVGACCQSNNACSLETDADCAKIPGGTWLGADSICASCPCELVCPPGSLQENEQVCEDGYIDTTNGGCDAQLNNYKFISLGDTYCGTAGVFLDEGLNPTPDSDWYELKIINDVVVEWRALAEFTSRLTIYDGNSGCPGTVVADVAATPCTDYAAVASLPGGIHFLRIAPLSFNDDSPCGADYTVSLNEVQPCAWDVDGNFAVDVDDLIACILAWGTADPDADIDGSGLVDVDDLVEIILHWGPCPGFEVAAPDIRSARIGTRDPGLMESLEP